MSYDKLDFSRPVEKMKPQYHSSASTLLSAKSKSKELLNISNASADDRRGLPSAGGYTQVAILTEPCTRKASSGHLSQGEIPPVSLT